MMKTVTILLCAINVLTLVKAESQIFLESFNYMGDGCPFGSVSLEGMKLKFNEFNASTGPGIPVTFSRRICQLVFNVRVMGGWQFGFSESEMEGAISLEDQLHKATLSSSMNFIGSREQMKNSTSYVGPVKKDLVLSDKFPASSVVWSRCSNPDPMLIKVVATLEGRNRAAGSLGISSFQFKLDTRKC